MPPQRPQATICPVRAPTENPTIVTPLVLLPGLVCDAAVWGAQIRVFSARHTIHVASYGDLDSLPAMAEHVLAHAPPRFALAGHSMGGRVALEVIRLAPERVVRLALLEEIARMFERKSASIFAAQVRALLNRPEAMPLLAGIGCPVLVLAGRSDPLSRPEANREMAAAIPGARLVILENCGHMAPQELPEEVNRHLAEWLDRGAAS